MRKKYVWLPGALLAYCLAMGWYGWRSNGGPTPGFWLIAAVEAVVIVALCLVLRAQQKRRDNRRDEG